MEPGDILVKVKTTLPILPLPPLPSRPAIKTPRLILQPFSQEHLAGCHAIRTREEDMVNSTQGRVDRDLDETQIWLNRFLPPNDAHTYSFAIIHPPTGEMIGMCGLVRMNAGTKWPEVGYGLNKEFHGQGLASEMLRAFLEFWWTVPREEREAEFQSRYVADAASDGTIHEHLMAIASADNGPSIRVLDKAHFTKFGEWEEPLPGRQESASAEQLVGYHLPRP